MVAKALNDGPESLVFVPAADSPTGMEMLLAATPLAARMSVYVVHKGVVRPDDGSCATTATCGYIPTADGGTGTMLYSSVAELCANSEITTLNRHRGANLDCWAKPRSP